MLMRAGMARHSCGFRRRCRDGAEFSGQFAGDPVGGEVRRGELRHDAVIGERGHAGPQSVLRASNSIRFCSAGVHYLIHRGVGQSTLVEPEPREGTELVVL